MVQTRVVEKIETHFLRLNLPPPPPENLAVYEIMWINIVESDRPHMTIWHMRIEYWISKDTNRNPERAILIAFPLQQWL